MYFRKNKQAGTDGTDTVSNSTVFCVNDESNGRKIVFLIKLGESKSGLENCPTRVNTSVFSKENGKQIVINSISIGAVVKKSPVTRCTKSADSSSKNI